jgi:hypothetical protein
VAVQGCTALLVTKAAQKIIGKQSLISKIVSFTVGVAVAAMTADLIIKPMTNLLNRLDEFGVIKHNYHATELNFTHEDEEDLRPVGMAQADVKIQDPMLTRIRHTRKIGVFIPTIFKNLSIDLFPLPDRMFDASLEIITEISTPKNISLFEAPSTISTRLRNTSNTLQAVNYNKFNLLNSVDLHNNSVLVAYGIYLAMKQKQIACPFPRESSQQVV